MKKQFKKMIQRKNLLLIGLLSLIGCSPECNLRYGDQVRVKTGFYQNATGTIDDIFSLTLCNRYLVDLNMSDRRIGSKYLKCSELEKIK